MNSREYTAAIANGELDGIFSRLYGSGEVLSARDRYTKLIGDFEYLYGKDREVSLFSVPGRSEISGNHTDHNHGKVLAASVNLDIIAVASRSSSGEIHVKSRGFSEDVVRLGNPGESSQKFRSKALLMGVCDGFRKNGFNIGAFDAFTDSKVFKGSGLSSSAAFEDMIGTIINHLYNGGRVDFIRISQISRYAENVFFGKPSGLMDQIACAAGGFVGIDFGKEEPDVRRIELDLKKIGYELIIINTGGNHADLNDDYASVPAEMKAVAGFFGKEYLREVDENDFSASVGALRKYLSELSDRKVMCDRAILRAYHFFEENKRVERQITALENGDVAGFLDGVRRSGESSFQWLQNIYSCKAPDEQGLSLALMICEKYLSGKNAAWRVHGGGFAGTVQAFVPTEYADGFMEKVRQVFGKDSAVRLFIRQTGACVL